MRHFWLYVYSAVLTIMLVIILHGTTTPEEWFKPAPIKKPEVISKRIQISPQALAHLTPPERPTAKKAAASLADSRVQIFEDAVYRLEQLGERSVPVLNDILMNPNYETDIYLNTIYAIGRLGYHGVEATDPLFEYLKKDEQALKIATIQALGKIGNTGRHSVVFLRPLLNDSNPETRRQTRIALQRIGSESALRAINQR